MIRTVVSFGPTHPGCTAIVSVSINLNSSGCFEPRLRQGWALWNIILGFVAIRGYGRIRYSESDCPIPNRMSQNRILLVPRYVSAPNAGMTKNPAPMFEVRSVEPRSVYRIKSSFLGFNSVCRIVLVPPGVSAPNARMNGKSPFFQISGSTVRRIPRNP
jgi:hypothetical protein